MRPWIVIVDDTPSVLAEVLNALERRFGSDYRIAAFLSAQEALDELERMQQGAEPVALVIADQWMPDMTGLELLGRVYEMHRHAKRALMVEWGDKSSAPTILKGCAFGQLDNYILKPWHPAEVYLYPPVSEFLAEWTRAYGPRMEIVRVVGESPSRRSHEVQDVLARNGIPYGFYPADSDAARQLLASTGVTPSRLPVLLMLDGRILIDPSHVEILDALGVTNVESRSCDVTIVGAGPAGLAAAVYAASEGLQTIVIEREAIGGQAGTSSLIRNYLGFPRGISGAELAQRAYQQAWLFGAKYVFARQAVDLRMEGQDKIVELDDGTSIRSRAVVIASGAHYRRLGIDSVERLVGTGVYYVAPGADTRVMRGRDAYVAGGGNSAGQAAVHLAKEARRVTLLVRGDDLHQKMSDYLVQEIRHLPNINVELGCEVVGCEGVHSLERILIRDRTNGHVRTVPAETLFILIGALPHTGWLRDCVQLDKRKFVRTGADVEREFGENMPRLPLRFETSMPGVFAAGDVRYGSEKRVASAVGEGSSVFSDIYEYLNVHFPQVMELAQHADMGGHAG